MPITGVAAYLVDSKGDAKSIL